MGPSAVSSVPVMPTLLYYGAFCSRISLIFSRVAGSTSFHIKFSDTRAEFFSNAASRAWPPSSEMSFPVRSSSTSASTSRIKRKRYAQHSTLFCSSIFASALAPSSPNLFPARFNFRSTALFATASPKACEVTDQGPLNECFRRYTMKVTMIPSVPIWFPRRSRYTKLECRFTAAAISLIACTIHNFIHGLEHTLHQCHPSCY